MSAALVAMMRYDIYVHQSGAERSAERGNPSRERIRFTLALYTDPTTAERIVIHTHESAIRIISKRGPLNNPADRDHCLQ